jgi:hypothetical protein
LSGLLIHVAVARATGIAGLHGQKPQGGRRRWRRGLRLVGRTVVQAVAALRVMGSRPPGITAVASCPLQVRHLAANKACAAKVTLTVVLEPRRSKVADHAPKLIVLVIQNVSQHINEGPLAPRLSFPIDGRFVLL